MVFYLWIAIKIIAESFPVSSSGHLILFEKFVFLLGFGNQISFLSERFDYAFQIVTVFVIIFFLRKKIFFVTKDIRKIFPAFFQNFTFIFLADCATAFFYLIFSFFGGQWFPMILGFLLTALILFSLLWVCPEKYRPINSKIAILLGIVQGISLLPGISRLGSTFAVGRWAKLSPKKAFEFSLLMELPLIFAASVKGMFELFYKTSATKVLNITTIWVMVASGIVAYLVLCWVSKVAYTRKFWRFSIYFLIPILFYLYLFK